jgi:hypothetical protein
MYRPGRPPDELRISPAFFDLRGHTGAIQPFESNVMDGGANVIQWDE